MTNPSDQSIELPALSDQAAVDILDFIGALFQVFETRYAAQIYRYYLTSGVVHVPPDQTDDEPF